MSHERRLASYGLRDAETGKPMGTVTPAQARRIRHKTGRRRHAQPEMAGVTSAAEIKDEPRTRFGIDDLMDPRHPWRMKLSWPGRKPAPEPPDPPDLDIRAGIREIERG
jgi:hypothetical protein